MKLDLLPCPPLAAFARVVFDTIFSQTSSKIRERMLFPLSALAAYPTENGVENLPGKCS